MSIPQIRTEAIEAVGRKILMEYDPSLLSGQPCPVPIETIMKSVQGDSGHAQVKMVADVYSHIIDEDRCINAQRLEEAFYSSKTPDPVEDTEPKTADTAVTESDESDAAKILELLKNPETAALLKQLAKAL